MNTSIICSLHIELNSMSPLVSHRFSCYMAVMLEFHVKPHYPLHTLHIKLISLTTSSLVFGLSEAWDLARKEIQKSQKKQKYQYDRHGKQRDFRAGDRVMVLYAL